jgi:hypothetical protein
MLSKGVTARRDSVNPAPNPATTVLGPDILPFSSWRVALIASKATNPGGYVESERGNSVANRYQLTDSSLERISDDQCCTSCVPLLSERRPWEFLALGKTAIELRAGLCDCGHQLAKGEKPIGQEVVVHSAG